MKAYFNWMELRPDSREFRMNSTVLEPQNFVVVVDVPETAEYLANYQEVANAQVTNQSVPEPLFTFAAVQYCIKQAEKYFPSSVVTSDDFKQSPDDEDDDDEWVEEPVKEKSTKASDGDDWEDVIDTDDKDEKWDENTENWEEE